MGVLARLQERSGGPRVRLARALRGAYLDTRRLAIQLRRHAEHVPYPGLGPKLTRLAEQADGQAALLVHELRALAGNTDQADPLTPRDGRNHWERLTFDLADLEALHRRYAEIALQWDLVFPATVATVDQLARSTATMIGTIRAMVARSDPHADN
ncbi:MAG: hypothetical protein ABIR79_05060 [Candidatus Binatia bacterium]